MQRIYLDNAATTPVRPEVLQAMLPFYTEHFGNPSSTHTEGRVTRAAIERSRKTIAQAIGANTNELFFTSGGTEANNTALKCAVRDLGVQRIISSPIEHACVMQTTMHLRNRRNVQLDYVELDSYGRAKLDVLEQMLQASQVPTLVSLMHANNEIGTLNDIVAIGKLCEKYKAYFHTDTVQTIGHFPIDVRQMNVHFLSGSAHKLHGPKGIGFLYMRHRVGVNPFIHGGGQERQMRSGTENVAGIVGFGKAVELAVADMQAHQIHIEQLRNCFIEKLEAIFPEVRFNGDYRGKYLYTVLNVTLPTDIAQAMLLFQLDLKGVAASGGSACSSGANKGSHVLQTIGADLSHPSVRFSFSYMNTLQEIENTVQALTEILLKAPVIC